MFEEKKINIKNIRLEYKDKPGAGKQIYAMIGKKFNCFEFTIRDDVPVPILDSVFIGTEPWIQFPPKEWNEMIEAIFTEIVRLWNKKYGNQKVKEKNNEP